MNRTFRPQRAGDGDKTTGESRKDLLSGPVKVTLSKDRVARFSTGEQGVWGVKSNTASAKLARARDQKNNFDGSFNEGVCLEIEVAEPGDGPIVVYSIPMARGRFQPTSLRMGSGVISWLPSPFSLKGTEIGGCDLGLPLGKSIIDPSIARGRKIWWRGLRE